MARRIGSASPQDPQPREPEQVQNRQPDGRMLKDLKQNSDGQSLPDSQRAWLKIPVWCRDSSFVLKTLLHIRRQHNLSTHIVFANLVKAFDTKNHKLPIEILEKYGAQSKEFCNAIEMLYTNLKVVLKIGIETAEISQGVGVRQGDNLSPVLFLFLMSAFAKTLEWERAKANLPKVCLHRASMETAEEFAKGQLTGHDR
ncbi:hypothetical protein ACHAWF_003009 [Thalassiosira exigua]